MNSQLPTIRAPRRRSTVELDPLSAAHVYYGEHQKRAERVRTYSAVIESAARSQELAGLKIPGRRSSHDERTSAPLKFYIPVNETLERLIAREDTDKNMQITIDDLGPKVLSLGTSGSRGHNKFEIRGTYLLSNLLQELSLAKKFGNETVILDERRLNENPVARLSRLIEKEFWPNLTRKIDGANIEQVARDPKDWTDDPRPRIYIPRGAPEQYEYYTRIALKHPEINLDVQWLAEDCDNEEYVRDLNDKPGLLAVAMEEYVVDEKTGEKDLRGCPFVVPGGRFNELYGWDSYMESLGLFQNGRLDLVKGMIQNHCFLIKHYNKILNANRSYYLCRSQPPFLTDMARQYYERTKHEGPTALEFYRDATLAAIKEYYTVWMHAPRYDPVTGLSRYWAGGFGVPPETEASHFTHLLEPYAKKHNMEYKEFIQAYNHRKVLEPELDEYFIHDRGVRESGHDTSYRLEHVAAHLATVDLNSLLFKYEQDIAWCIRNCFGDKLKIPPEWRAKGQAEFETSATWDRRWRKRRVAMDKYLWNEEKGMYFDYNTVKKKPTTYECATTFWPLWAGAATPRQASLLVSEALPKLEAPGGLLSGSKFSRGETGLSRPNRQWDYPYGWAPQQILAWVGLKRYGFDDTCQRLIYKWLYMVTKAFVDFNGVVVEKYDIMQPIAPHKVEAEYGNQGADFIGVATEGFGWVNASYVVGLSMIDVQMKRALGACTNWETFDRARTVLGLGDDESDWD